MRFRRMQLAVAKRRATQGYFFLGALLIVAFLGALLPAALTRATTEQRAARQLSSTEQAFQLAEAGIDDALVILTPSSVQWNDNLVGADGVGGTPDDGLLAGIGISQSWPAGTYTARVVDNADEGALQDNPFVDRDGTIRLLTTGTAGTDQRQIEVMLWGAFSHAVAAQTDILLRQASAMGGMHANGNIEVRQTSTMVGCSQATASGTFIIPAGETLVHSCGDLTGGDAPLTFFQPDETALRNAVTRWDAANWKGTIVLFPNDIVGYERELSNPPNTPHTVSLAGGSRATIVMFSGHSIRFRQSLGTFDAAGNCLTPVNLSVLALGGGSIEFEQPVCLRGLVWAEGSIIVAQSSRIMGAIVSAGSFIDIKQGTLVSFDPTAIDASLLPGFSGLTVRSWREE